MWNQNAFGPILWSKWSTSLLRKSSGMAFEAVHGTETSAIGGSPTTTHLSALEGSREKCIEGQIQRNNTTNITSP